MLLILIVVVVAVVSSVGTFLPHQLMMAGASGMMGGSAGGVMMNFFWPTMMAVSVAGVAVVLAYIIAFPAIKYSTSSGQEELSQFPPASTLDPMDIVMRVAKLDERAALEVVKSNGGICLQKDITYKTGLSKLKTHRIVARLAERGILQVKKVGKTNEISVPLWLKAQSSKLERGSTEVS
jgi:uncharacterized membrane protein